MNRAPDWAERPFEHEKLDVYTVSLRLIVVLSERLQRFPSGTAWLVDQLRRAVLSVVLNVAEGAGEFSPGDKRRFFRMARRSANEAAAALDVAEALGLMARPHARELKTMLARIAAMLIAIDRMEGSRAANG